MSSSNASFSLDGNPGKPPQEYLERIMASFNSHNSDLTIVCGSERFKVHRFHLSAHSEVFDKMLNGPFKEGGQKEIELPDDDPAALREVLRYMYSFKYDPDISGQNELLLHLDVFLLADKYRMRSLNTRAYNKFEDNALYDRNISQFAEAIHEVYEYDELAEFRELVVRLAMRKLEYYEADHEKYKPFWVIVKPGHPFAADLTKANSAKRAASPSDGIEDKKKDEVDEATEPAKRTKRMKRRMRNRIVIN